MPLLEDGYGAQVIVARVGDSGGAPLGAPSAPDRPAADHPVAAAFTELGVPFIFVNAARPVVLQRFALAHAFAHHVLGHGDVVDRRIEWSRNVPPEAAANDFAEELLAPVRAVQRWYERRAAPRWLASRISWASATRSASAPGRPSTAHGRRAGCRASSSTSSAPSCGGTSGSCCHARRTWAGSRDTLAHLTPDEVLPQGEYGGPAVLRVPAAMRAWALAALGERPSEPRGRRRHAPPRGGRPGGAARPPRARVGGPLGGSLSGAYTPATITELMGGSRMLARHRAPSAAARLPRTAFIVTLVLAVALPLLFAAVAAAAPGDTIWTRQFTIRPQGRRLPRRGPWSRRRVLLRRHHAGH